MIGRDPQKTAQLKVLMHSQAPELGKALILIQEGADPDTVDVNGDTLIHRLSNLRINQKGQFNKFIIQLVKVYGAKINIQNNAGFTPLQSLLNTNNATPEQIMSFISLDLGVDVNVLDISGQSFIHRISGILNNHKAYSKMIKTLVEKYDADIEIVNVNGWTPFQSALNNPGVFMLALIELILLGAKSDVLSVNGDSFLQRVIYPANNPNNVHGRRISQLVKEKKIILDFPNGSGLTPLQMLMDMQNLFYPSIECLLSLGANPDQLNSNGDSLLHLLPLNLTYSSHLFLFDLIKKYKANIHVKNASGQTPLEYVLDRTPLHVDLALQLITLGADELSINKEGKTIFEMLAGKEHQYSSQLANLKRIREKRKALKSNIHQARSGFINFLIIIAHAKQNKSFVLPHDIIMHIIGFFDFKAMDKTQQEGILLANAIFNEFSNIKLMLSYPGGVNVFQSKKSEKEKVKFNFFKSTTSLCLDFLKLEKQFRCEEYPISSILLKKELSPAAKEKLIAFKNNYAMSVWKEHSKVVSNPSLLKIDLQSEPLYAGLTLN